MAINDLTVKTGLMSLDASGAIQQGSNVPAETVSGGAVGQKASVTTPTETGLMAQTMTEEQQLAALQERVVELNSYMQTMNRSLQFSIDEQSGQTVVKVIDADTEQLIRQIPAEELLAVKSSLEEYRGMLLEASV